MPSLSEFIPRFPRFSLEWAEMDETYAWIRSLRGCIQDPIHHAEGDVWIHTRMVLEELVANPEWQALDPEKRFVTFGAAALHDVAKPAFTRIEKDQEGRFRVTSKGHSRGGKLDARRILWRMNVPFDLRERICAIIGVHQTPFYLIDRDAWDQKARVIAISQSVEPCLLAMVAEADARGRICGDRQRIIDNVDLFREIARDAGCYDKAYSFPDSHTAFTYFQDPEGRSPDFPAFDDTRCSVTVLSGFPGSGKTTWRERNADGRPVVSLDDLRSEMGVDPEDEQGSVRQAARERARTYLRKEQDFIWDATNLSQLVRFQTLSLLADYKARIEIVYLERPEPVIRNANRARQNPVPDKAIDRMIERWEVPEITEAHSVQYLVES